MHFASTRPGPARPGTARHDRHGTARRGTHGAIRHGTVRHGTALPIRSSNFFQLCSSDFALSTPLFQLFALNFSGFQEIEVLLTRTSSSSPAIHRTLGKD